MPGDTTADRSPQATARAYYRALDEGDYDLLTELLAPGFVHERPDMTLEGRDEFVQFMREERPMTDTTHAIDGIYRRTEVNNSNSDRSPSRHNGDLLVRGRLLSSDSDVIVRFVDRFSVDGNSIVRVETFTN